MRSLWPYLDSKDFYLSLLFIILSGVFFGLSSEHDHNAQGCDKSACFDTQLDSYDIFHSNWHIFTSIGLIFWTNTMLFTYPSGGNPKG